jgi:MoxR-like ATPase
MEQQEEEEDEIDVFLYEDDATLARTTSVAATLQGWNLRIEGRSYEIETRPSSDTIAVVREPTREEHAAWLERLDALDRDAHKAIEQAEAGRTTAHEGAVDHLFVHRSYAGSAYASIDDATAQLRRLRVAVGKTKESLESGAG